MFRQNFLSVFPKYVRFALSSAARISLLATCTAFATPQADRQLLETLVAKGVCSVDEAAYIAKSSVEILAAISGNESTVKISAKMQTQYAYIDASSGGGFLQDDSSELNAFMIRRMILTFDADNKLDWGARLSFDFLLANKVSISYLWHRVDCDFAKGEFRFGYIKPNFCLEENMSPFKLYCVERSIATYYWGGPRNSRRLGFGSFMTGTYWFGQSRSVKGLEYAVAATNSENYRLGYETISRGANNSPNLWFSSYYATDVFDSAKVKFGLNFGYGADANKEVSGGGASIVGVNPYITLNCGSLRTAVEFLLSRADGGNMSVSHFESEMPMGLNFLAEYKFDIGETGKLAPVFRFTWLDTDGRGVTPSDGLRKCANIVGDHPYDRVFGLYFGLNWYINGDNLKFQTGYEFSRFDGSAGTSSPSSHSLDANSARAQIQMLF